MKKFMFAPLPDNKYRSDFETDAEYKKWKEDVQKSIGPIVLSGLQLLCWA